MPADSPQVERLVEIGTRLRECRESQGLTIESVAATTKIQRRILQALEAADSSSLPEPVYVRGFIAKYATALGLDGSEIAQEYPLQNGIVPVRSQRVLSVIPAPQLKPAHLVMLYIGVLIASVLGLSALLRQSQPAPSTVIVQPPVASPSPAVTPTPRSTASPSPPARPTAAASPSPSPTPSPSPSPTPSPSPSSSPTPSPSPSPSPTPTASVTPKPTTSPRATTPTPSPRRTAAQSPRPAATSSPARSPVPALASGGDGVLLAQGIASQIRFPQRLNLAPIAPVRVNVRLTARSWVRILTDGKVTYEGVLPEGTQRLVTGQRNVVVVTGNAGGTFLSYNEGTERKLGNTGAVQSARFGTPGAGQAPGQANRRSNNRPNNQRGGTPANNQNQARDGANRNSLPN